jgi:hypothetical protein
MSSTSNQERFSTYYVIDRISRGAIIIYYQSWFRLMYLKGSENDQCAVKHCTVWISIEREKGHWKFIQRIPSNWIIFRSRRASKAIRSSNILSKNEQVD